MMYTIDDARREVRQSIKEGDSMLYIRIFLNDLARGHDLTWEEVKQINEEILAGQHGNIDTGLATL